MHVIHLHVHSIFLTNDLFVTAIVASIFAMLRILIVILFQAYRSKFHPARHAASLIIGQTLKGNEVQSKSQMRSDSVKRLVQLYYVSGSAPLENPS